LADIPASQSFIHSDEQIAGNRWKAEERKTKTKELEKNRKARFEQKRKADEEAAATRAAEENAAEELGVSELSEPTTKHERKGSVPSAVVKKTKISIKPSVNNKRPSHPDEAEDDDASLELERSQRHVLAPKKSK